MNSTHGKTAMNDDEEKKVKSHIKSSSMLAFGSPHTIARNVRFHIFFEHDDEYELILEAKVKIVTQF